MNLRKVVLISMVGVILGLGCLESASAKEEYPAKTIQLIVGWPVGGDTDLVARVWAEYAKPLLGQPIVVINKPGVAGVLGSTFVSKAKPDGYTFMQSPPGNVLVAPQITKVDYKTDDFIPICRITATPCAIVVHADSPWKKMEDFVQDAKKNPGKLSFGSLGMSSWTNLAFKFWEMQAGIKLKDIFQQGSAPATMALLGRHVDISFLYPQVFIPHVKDGKFRVLAIGAPWDEYPQVPTFKSLGYKGNFNGWSGIFAPKGTPPEIVKKIEETSKKVMADPKFLGALKNVNSTPGFMGTEEWQKSLKQEYDDLSKVIDELGIRAK
jgi:tripartite-type tricarboxylate transporter receptor subunit TctC